MYAPVVDSLTLTSTGTFSTVALVNDVGATPSGLYLLSSTGAWRRVIPYRMLSGFVFESVNVFAYLPNAGTTTLQAAALEGTRVQVLRNANAITAFTVSGNNVVLNTPSQTNDTFSVLSFVIPGGGSGGGIPDAPNDSKAYVRKSLSWQDLNNQTLTEGTFGS